MMNAAAPSWSLDRPLGILDMNWGPDWVLALDKGGPLIEVMAYAGEFRSSVDMLEACVSEALSSAVVDKMSDLITSAKCRVLHLGHTMSIKGLGPLASSPDTIFCSDGTLYTCVEWFEMRAAINPRYGCAVGADGLLLHPFLPTANIGTAKRPMYVPALSIVLLGGLSESALNI